MRPGFLLVERSYSSESENSETDTWLDYAMDCEYITQQQHEQLAEQTARIGAMLGGMLNHPDRFLLKP